MSFTSKVFITVLVLLATAPLYVISLTPTLTPYSPFNTHWNGYSLASSNWGGTQVLSPLEVKLNPKENTYIIVPQKPVSTEEANALRSFVLNGGVLIVLSDKSEPANRLLEELGCTTRLSGSILRDPIRYLKTPELAKARTPSPAPNNTLLLDVATVVEPGENTTILCMTSPSAFVDVDENGYYTPGEPKGMFPIVVSERLGMGRVVVVGDPDIMVNKVIETSRENAALLGRVIGSRKPLFDVGHLNQTLHGVLKARLFHYSRIMRGSGLLPLIVLAWFAPLVIGGGRISLSKKDVVAAIAVLALSVMIVLYSGNTQTSLTLLASSLASLLLAGLQASILLQMIVASSFSMLASILLLPLLLFSFYRSPQDSRRTMWYAGIASVSIAWAYPRILAFTISILILWVASTLYSRILASSLEAVVSSGEKLTAMMDSVVTIVIKGRSKRSFTVTGVVEAPSKMLVEPKRISTRVGENGGIIKLRVKSAIAGKRLLKLHVVVSEPLGLGKTSCVIEVPITVEPLHRIALRIAMALLGETREAPGTSMLLSLLQEPMKTLATPRTIPLGDLVGARDFIPGDDPRLIHWKKTASRSKLIVVERQSTAGHRSIVLADLTHWGEEDFDLLLYSLLYVLDRMVLEESGKISIYVYNKDRVMFAAKSLPPRIALKNILLKLPNMMKTASKLDKALLPYGSPLKTSKKLSSYHEKVLSNYKTLIADHPAGKALNEIVKEVSREPVKIYLIHSDHALQHVYAFIERKLREFGADIEKPVQRLKPIVEY